MVSLKLKPSPSTPRILHPEILKHQPLSCQDDIGGLVNDNAFLVSELTSEQLSGAQPSGARDVVGRCGKSTANGWKSTAGSFLDGS